MASRLARQRCLRAVTKARSSPRRRSFQSPCRVGELGADVDLVDRRVEPHPGEALGEGPGEAGEELGPVRVLEVPDPVGHPEVAQVDDRHDPQPPHLGEDEVGELPVVASGPVWTR